MKLSGLAVLIMSFVFTAHLSAFNLDLGSFASVEEIRSVLETKPEIGSWAEYESISGKENAKIIRYSVVGEEIVDGVVFSWIEWTISGDEEPNTVKILINSKLSEAGVPERVLVKQGDKAPIELPTALVKAGAWLSELGDFLPGDVLSRSSYNSDAKLELTEDRQTSINTTSGSIDTRYQHYVSNKNGDLEVWLNADIPFFALARVKSDDYQLNLKNYGKSGAVSRIGADEETKSIGDLIKDALKKKQ